MELNSSLKDFTHKRVVEGADVGFYMRSKVVEETGELGENHRPLMPWPGFEPGPQRCQTSVLSTTLSISLITLAVRNNLPGGNNTFFHVLHNNHVY